MEIKEAIRSKIKEVLKAIIEPGVLPETIEIYRPKKTHHGDYSTNIALVLSKSLKKDSILLSGEIVGRMEKNTELFDRIQVVPPGFINFFLSKTHTYQTIDSIIRDTYPTLDEGQIIRIRNLAKTNKGLKAALTDDRVHSIQYMYSRIHSIIKHFKNEGISIPHVEGLSMGAFEGDVEYRLVKEMVSYPSVVGNVVRTNDPEELLQYLMEITQLFYDYHQGIQFRKLETARLLGVLKVLEGLRVITGHLLGLLGLEAPEKM